MTAMLNPAPRWSHTRGNTVVPSSWQATTNTLVGKIKAEKKIGGPISIDILCMDGNGQVLSESSSGFADQDKIEAGGSGTFSDYPGSGRCDQYLVSASGYGF